jgi:hypothetical protein
MYNVPNPQLGLQFSALVGVLQLATDAVDSGAYILTPRFSNDVVLKSASSVVTSIVDLQDPTSPGAPAQTCENPNGTTTVGKCATANLTAVVVTAVDGYVSKNLRGLWVQDPNVTDGQFAGIKVTYPKAGLPYMPAIGDVVDVKATSILYRGGMQLQAATITPNATFTASIAIAPVTVPATALDRKDPNTHTYEGVLVQVDNAVVDQACVEDTSLRDQGGWTLVGDVLVGTDWFYAYDGGLRDSSLMCLDAAGEPTGACSCAAHSRPADMRKAGDTFSQLIGIVDFAYGDYQLNPRGDSDLVK